MERYFLICRKIYISISIVSWCYKEHKPRLWLLRVRRGWDRSDDEKSEEPNPTNSSPWGGLVGLKVRHGLNSRGVLPVSGGFG